MWFWLNGSITFQRPFLCTHDGVAPSNTYIHTYTHSMSQISIALLGFTLSSYVLCMYMYYILLCIIKYRAYLRYTDAAREDQDWLATYKSQIRHNGVKNFYLKPYLYFYVPAALIHRAVCCLIFLQQCFFSKQNCFDFFSETMMS